MTEQLKHGPAPKLTARDKFELRQNVEAGVPIKVAAAMAGVSLATAMRALAELRRKLGPENRKNQRLARAYLYQASAPEKVQPKDTGSATKNSDGFVYVFAAGAHVKIGISQFDVDARWWQIKSSNPLLEPPLYISPPVGAACARELEGIAHELLRKHRCSGEWFSCERELAIETVKKLVERSLAGMTPYLNQTHRNILTI